MNDKTAQLELPEVETKPSFCRQVWDRLSRVDVSAHIENKGTGTFQVGYLSWSWAYAQLMKRYPESVISYPPEDVRPDGTVMVNCTICVNEGDNVMCREMFLPVMNAKMQAVENPNARQISDTRQRCMVKCLSLFGLGLDLWTGSDYAVGTEDDPISEDQRKLLESLLEKSGRDVAAFLEWLSAKSIAEIPVAKYNQARLQLERAVKSRNQK